MRGTVWPIAVLRAYSMGSALARMALTCLSINSRVRASSIALASSAVAWVSGNGRVSSWRFTAVKIAASAAGVGATEIEEECKEVLSFSRS